MALKIGERFRVLASGYVYKTTKVVNNELWGSLIIDEVLGRCRQGRPSKFSLDEVRELV